MLRPQTSNTALSTDPVVKEAREWYFSAIEALTDQRRQIEEDLKFSDPSNPQQWDDTERQQREGDPGGARPCLVFDQTNQYTATVVGQIEQSPPSLHAIPSASGADQKVAEQLDGLYRHIEYSSRATQQYMRALTSAARAGAGYLIVRPVYTDRAANLQEPRISSEGDPLKVVFDPWSVEVDGSDADRAQLLTGMSYAAFEAKYGSDAAKVSFVDPEGSYCDMKDTIYVAEDWKKETTSANMIVCKDDEGAEFSLSEDDYWAAHKAGNAPKRTGATFKDKVTKVWWRVMSGAAVLEQCTDSDGKPSPYPADGIGVVPVYGYTAWSDGRMKYCGIPRRARDPQRAYNYHMSEVRAFMNAAPKSPWLASIRAIKGLERLWDRASVDSRAYLPYNDVDENGQPVPAPQRAALAVNLQNYTLGAQQALHDIQASLGMYQATLGAPSNETSGVAIDARKQQGEAATSVFPNHLAGSVAQVGKLVLQMLPKLIDTARQMRILGIDHTPGHVNVDPGQKEAFKEDENGLTINPNVGKYDARVVVGAPFTTQRSQANAAFTEMMRSNKEMTPAIAPFWAGTLDIPNADKFQQALIAMAPEPVKAILQPENGQKGPTTAELTQQVAQLKQQLQQAVEIAHQAQSDADQAHQELESKSAEHVDKGTSLAIDAFNAETNRLKVLAPAMQANQIEAAVQKMLSEMIADPNPWPGEPAQPQAMPQAMPPAEPVAPQPDPMASAPQPTPLAPADGAGAMQ